MGFFSKIKEGLRKTRENVSASIQGMLHSFTKIDDELFEELEELLVMGDVAFLPLGAFVRSAASGSSRKVLRIPSVFLGS